MFGVIQMGDQVRIRAPEDEDGDTYCYECDVHIGFDEWEMSQFGGKYLEVEKVIEEGSAYFKHPSCGAQVFKSSGWLWTTCWIDRHIPSSRTPSWEV